MTDVRALVGRTVTKPSTRDGRTFVTFLDRTSTDTTGIRLYLDGEFEVDPEPEGSNGENLELAIYLRLGETRGATVDHAELSADGDLYVEFSNGIQVTAFGPPTEQAPYKTWQLQER